LHHPDPSRMRRAVMRKTAGEVASFEEVVGEGLDHIVERILAMRPGLEEMRNVAAAVLARRADKCRGHLHLMEGLVPDVVQSVRLGHPRPDGGIDEVEEEKSCDARSRVAREWLH